MPFDSTLIWSLPPRLNRQSVWLIDWRGEGECSGISSTNHMRENTWELPPPRRCLATEAAAAAMEIPYVERESPQDHEMHGGRAVNDPGRGPLTVQPANGDEEAPGVDLMPVLHQRHTHTHTHTERETCPNILVQDSVQCSPCHVEYWCTVMHTRL